jgi:acyl-CoA synthetase (AMP-forming)/AMP-acid ligase II
MGEGVARNLGELLRLQAERRSRRPFLRFEDRALSFGEVEERTKALAESLAARGVEKGDRVAVMLPNGLEFPVAWLSLARLGAVLVPLNVQYKAHDLAYTLRDSGASVAVVDSSLEEAIASVIGQCPALRETIAFSRGSSWKLEGSSAAVKLDDCGLSDVLNIQYTSGTTGAPKGCLLTHEYWLSMARLSWELTGLSEDDCALTAQPFHYIDPQWNTLMCLYGGIPLVILPRFSASTFWRSVKEAGATYFYVLGAMPIFLLKQPPDPAFERGHRVKLVTCSGIPRELHAELEARFHAPWREAYGTTESGVDLAVSVGDRSSVGSGAMGKPVPGKEARVVDPSGRDLEDGEIGELLVRGKPMMLGYWKKPEATAEKIREGWMHTGDLVFRDERGYFHIVGRLKDMIRRGGENVSAAEVETVLASHPEVLAAAVVSVPDELRGEEIKAFVQLRIDRGREGDDPEAILEFARARLAPFKIPRFLQYVNDFPRTPSERIEKHKLTLEGANPRAGSYDARERRWLP